MERLTKRIDLGNGKTTVDFSDSKCGEFLTNHKEGVRALFEKLADYEDAEEQGVLLRMPCKVGDSVWAITSPINLGFDEGETLEVYKCVVESISFYNNRKHQIRLYSGGVFVTWYVRVSDFGKQVFLTKEEAEQALAKMKEV